MYSKLVQLKYTYPRYTNILDRITNTKLFINRKSIQF